MKWFRSNIRLGSRLALLALAIQFLLSFGHVHGGSAQASPALLRASPAHRAVSFAVADRDASDPTVQASGSGHPGVKTSSGHGRGGQPADDCAICAVMALAGAMVIATPPCLLGPPTAGFSYSIADAGFADLISACVGFQPRAPPIS